MNLSASGKFISVDCAIGEYDQQPTEADYDFPTVKLDYAGFYGLDATVGKDFNGSYWELGYGSATEDTFFCAGVVKTFDLFSNRSGATRPTNPPPARRPGHYQSNTNKETSARRSHS